MAREGVLPRDQVIDIINIKKQYIHRKHTKPIKFDYVSQQLGKKQNNDKYEQAKLTFTDNLNREYLVIVQKVADDDLDNFTASLFLLDDRQQIFICRLDYGKEHKRTCKREQFKSIRAGNFHFHVHCEECVEEFGIDQIGNIAFTLDAESKKVDAIHNFLEFFFNTINVEMSPQFTLIRKVLLEEEGEDA
jgi:hypothetical protein